MIQYGTILHTAHGVRILMYNSSALTATLLNSEHINQFCNHCLFEITNYF